MARGCPETRLHLTAHAGCPSVPETDPDGALQVVPFTEPEKPVRPELHPARSRRRSQQGRWRVIALTDGHQRRDRNTGARGRSREPHVSRDTCPGGAAWPLREQRVGACAGSVERHEQAWSDQARPHKKGAGDV